MALKKFVLSQFGTYLKYSGSSNSQHPLFLIQDTIEYSGCSNNIWDLSGNSWFFYTGNTGDALDNLYPIYYYSYIDAGVYVRMAFNFRINISDINNPIGNTTIYSNLDDYGLPTNTWTQIATL